MNKFHELAKKNGWWSDDTGAPLFVLGQIPEKIALIHSEASEALECYRDGAMDLAYESGMGFPNDTKPVGFPSELADIVIRCYDLAGALNIDLDAMIEIKHKFNESRSYRHGGKRA